MPVHNHPPHGRKRLRKGRASEAGRVYLVTFVTASRQCVFVDWELALVAIRTLRNPALWRASRLLCWVLMPDHWHELIELNGSDSLSDVVRRFKGSIARAVNQARGCQGTLWVNGFHDHAIRADQDLIDVARYIVLNPVRAGLVARVGLYPFWDAVWLAGEGEHRG